VDARRYGEIMRLPSVAESWNLSATLTVDHPLVVGTEIHAHLLAPMGVDEWQVVWARGGELFDFDGFTVEVIPSLHSLDEDHRYLFPETSLAGQSTVDANLLGDYAAAVAAVSPESQVLRPQHLRGLSRSDQQVTWCRRS
jgi:hypothetical protein